MNNLIRFYMSRYLNILDCNPAMDDSDGWLSELSHHYDDTVHCIRIWSIASFL
jgi:hypothetical protein